MAYNKRLKLKKRPTDRDTIMIKTNNLFLLLCIVAALHSCKTASNTKAPASQAKFKETWESLSTLEREPEWFKNAKFGIYFH
jgi:alpha-L-fucosidase